MSVSELRVDGLMLLVVVMSLFRHCFATARVHVRYSSTINVFDRNTKRIQRDRSCLAPNYQDYEYVKSEIGYRVADRVFDVKRSFDSILDLGCQRGYVSKHLTKVISTQNPSCSNELLFTQKVSFEGDSQENPHV